jgi:hypothetical protein
MNRDDIIRMAREACETTSWKPGLGNEHVVEFMARFAALVTAAEREACARLCDELPDLKYGWKTNFPSDCAAAIRARGEKE